MVRQHTTLRRIPSVLPDQIRHHQWIGYPHTSGEPIDVLVNTLYRSMVGYIVEARTDSTGAPFKEPIGTVFFVSIQGAPYHFEYAVTCAHVVGPCRDGSSPTLFLRINRTSGEYEDIATATSEWISLEGSDVAVLPIAYGADVYRRWSYPIDEQMRASVITPVPGDQVFMVGLFVSCPGESSIRFVSQKCN